MVDRIRSIMFNKIKEQKRSLRAIYVLGVMAGAGLLASLMLITPTSDRSHVLSQSPLPTPTPNPQLALTKSIDNEAPSSDDIVTYTLAYSASESPATDVQLYDFLPAGVQLLSTNPPFASYANGVVVFDDALVEPEIETVTIQVRVLEGYERLHNHAVIVAECAEPSHASSLISVIAPSTPSSVLRLTKTGYSAVLSGDDLVYTLRCENVGSTTINQVKVIDVLPPDLALGGVSPPASSITPPIVQWSVGSLGPGETWESTITTTAPAQVGVITNTAFADAYSAVMTHTLFATNVVTDAGILRVRKEAHPTEVFVGDTITYTITYSNEGNQTATGVVLTDTFPADIDVIGYNPPPTSIIPERGVWELGSLNPDGSGQIVITAIVRGESGRWLYNVVHITGDGAAFPGSTDLFTWVQERLLYLPIVFRQFP
jgi:uncharacterized repeat protein (TIGR01451 family)